MDKEKISIVVPVYNAADYILQTIAMVKRQTYENWELLLVEDCSTDGTRKLLQDFAAENKDARIRVIFKEKNEGAAKARNTGVLQVSGAYLAFLDADDIWLPEKLGRELRFLQENQAAFVFTAYEFGDEAGVGTKKYVRVPRTLTYKEALSRTIIFTSTTLFDLGKIERELLLMPDVASEDTATWWQILKTGIQARGFDEVTTIYRRPANSLSSNKGKAIIRIWNLYRNVEHLSLLQSVLHFIPWAYRATMRRL